MKKTSTSKRTLLSTILIGTLISPVFFNKAEARDENFIHVRGEREGEGKIMADHEQGAPAPSTSGSGDRSSRDGSSGSGNRIIVEADKLDTDEEVCEDVKNNNDSLFFGDIPNALVLGHGETHDDYRNNISEQLNLIRLAKSGGNKVCVAMEFSDDGSIPYEFSQQKIYDLVEDMPGVTAFNMDYTQTRAYEDSSRDDTYGYFGYYADPMLYRLQIASMESRNSNMASAIHSALSVGVNGQECDKVVFVVGAAHVHSLLGKSLPEYLKDHGIDAFVTASASSTAHLCGEE